MNIKEFYGLENLGVVMFNCLHTIVEGAEETLKKGKHYGEYTSRNFFGTVWYENGKFHCDIEQYCKHVETIHADNLNEIMNITSAKYGKA